MAFKKDLILLISFFIILSTVIQSEDAYVQYYQSQNPTQSQAQPPSKAKLIISHAIFTLITFLTFMTVPYLNLTVKRLSLISCGILLIKYGCQLASFLNILRPIFLLASLLSDIIGQVLFYVSTIRFTFIICQKHDKQQRMGLLFGGLVALYAFSVFLGSYFGYLFYKNTPPWLFLIGQTSLTITAGCISYFAIMFESSSNRVNELNQQSSVRPNPNGNSNEVANNPQQQRQCELLKPGLTLPHVINFTVKTYGKKFPLMNVQVFLGALFTYGYYLLDYLVWKSQQDPVQQKLHNDLSIMLLYSAGGVVASLVIGFCCDKFNLRRFGYGLLVYTFLSMGFLYIAIYLKYYYTTLLLFMFLGITQFSVLTWMLCVCAKTYGGLLEVFSLNAQIITLASSLYVIGAILFEERMNLNTKFSLELAGMMVGCIISIIFLRKLPDGKVQIEYEYENENENESGQQNQNPGQNVEPNNNEANINELFVQDAEKASNSKNVEIQMVEQQRRMQDSLKNNKETIDPVNLL